MSRTHLAVVKELNPIEGTNKPNVARFAGFQATEKGAKPRGVGHESSPGHHHTGGVKKGGRLVKEVAPAADIAIVGVRIIVDTDSRASSGPCMMTRLLPKVLVVDDEPAVRMFLREALKPFATEVKEAADAAQALEAVESGDFDVIVCDIWMQGATGLDLLAIAQQTRWDVGFILVTGEIQADTVIAALRLRAADFLLKPFTVEEVTRSVSRAFEHLMLLRESRAYQGSLEATIQRRTQELEVTLSELQSNYQMTLEALVSALDAREHETFAHSLRVRAYTRRLAQQAGYPPALMPALEQAALLHDIGKVAVSDAILLKPAKLTPEEWVEIRKHSTAGEDILKRVPFLRPASAIVRHHHERYDGTGYPDGLAGAQIPMGARLFTIADTLDAMTSDRLYRETPGFEAAREEIQRCSGKQFDAQIVDLYLGVPVETWVQMRAEATSAAAPVK